MNKQNGFSLTEMSVVLVIMAMLVAGVMKGNNLIEAAKLQAIISESSEYKVALNSFVAKYAQYPGDFNGAVAFWGAAKNADGDNDGKIEFINTLGTPVYEGYRTWQHLAYAKMLKSPYLGTQTTAAAALEVDVPKSKSGGGFFLEYGVMGLTNVNSLILGAPVASTTTILTNGVFTPSQAQEIDAKMDDGNPSSGSVRSKDGNSSVAATCVTDPTSNGISTDDYYNIAGTGKDCILSFKMLEQ